MRASIALGLLKNNLSISETAEHFDVTPERVKQVLKDVKSYEAVSDVKSYKADS
jgi:hypothetical protein